MTILKIEARLVYKQHFEVPTYSRITFVQPKKKRKKSKVASIVTATLVIFNLSMYNCYGNLFLLINFSDPYRSKLRRLDLKNTNITNSGFNLLVKHNLRELRMHNCLYLTDDILSELNSHSHNLVELSIEPAAGVLPAYLPSLKGMIDTKTPPFLGNYMDDIGIFK